MADELESGTLDEPVPQGQAGEEQSTSSVEENSPTEDARQPIQEGLAKSEEVQLPQALQELAAKKGWTQDRAVEEAAKMAVSLESKLGNLSEVESKAKLYDQLAPLLASQQKAQQEQQLKQDEIDESLMTPQQIIDHRAQKVAQSQVQQLKAEIESQFVPFIQDYNRQKAESDLQSVRAKYKDFDQYAPQIAEFIDKNPTFAKDPGTLENVYKILSYDNAKKVGEKQTYDRLVKKSNSSVTHKTSAAPLAKKQFKTIQEALAAAEEETGISL